MKLIVDGGSTKADWTAIDNSGKVIFSTQTLGLNPEILDEEQILKRLDENTDLKNNKEQATHIFFYGAGCGSVKMQDYLGNIFKKYFVQAAMLIKEDTYAAVYATSQIGQKSIVCILGTGSNCSYFDGKIVHQKIQSLGYIIMDDASGNHFGKQLIRKYYYNKMPQQLADAFANEFDLSSDFIKNKLYKEDNPNAYLASFAKFLVSHKNDTFCKKIIKKGINAFIKNHINQFDEATEIPIHFVGSIAFYLKEEIQELFEKKGLKLGNVIRRPIDGLINYHVSAI